MRFLNGINERFSNLTRDLGKIEFPTYKLAVSIIRATRFPYNELEDYLPTLGSTGLKQLAHAFKFLNLFICRIYLKCCRDNVVLMITLNTIDQRLVKQSDVTIHIYMIHKYWIIELPIPNNAIRFKNDNELGIVCNLIQMQLPCLELAFGVFCAFHINIKHIWIMYQQQVELNNEPRQLRNKRYKLMPYDYVGSLPDSFSCFCSLISIIS